VGGRIEVASEQGKGSTFRFFIKTKTCHTSKRPAEDDGDNLEMVESKPALGKRSTNFKPMFPAGLKPHVLIVEDNFFNQTVLARQLRHVGLTCEGESWVAARLGRPFRIDLVGMSTARSMKCISR
jgi:hypothetical protein